MTKENDYEKYAKKRHEVLSNGGLYGHRFSEKPMMKSMISDLTGQKVLLLGCGTAEEVDILKSFGANEIVGIDLSPASIELAKKTHPDLEFIVSDMHDLPFEDNTFDFVYSSLVIHYSSKPKTVFNEVKRVLKNKGTFLFSIGHPLRYASFERDLDGITVRFIGYARDRNDGQTFGHYHTFIKNSYTWKKNETGIAGETLSFYTTSPSNYYQMLKSCGFKIIDFRESKCIQEAEKEDANYFHKYSEIPQFMAFKVEK